MANTPSKRGKWRLTGFGLLVLLGVFLAGLLVSGNAQNTSTRKVKSSVPPEYPELARRLNIKGVARVEATVARDGQVIKIKELGGNPVLVDALSRAVKKWRYEPAPSESVVEVKFEFSP